MKTHRSRTVCISAAVAAVLICGTVSQARDLVFDETTLADDGVGGKVAIWDTTSPNWLDAGASTTWINSPADSATIGTTNPFVGATPVNNIVLGEPITVQDLTIGIGANGATFNVVSFLDFGAFPLTLGGNITKIAGNGLPRMQLESGLILTAGDHRISAQDSPGGGTPELRIEAAISGAGNVLIDNAAVLTGVDVSWGTTAFIGSNTYTGTTTINNGRLIITTSTGLGDTAAGTTISNLGALGIGGAGTPVTAAVNLAEPITITRNTYSGGEFGRYPAAIIFDNTGTARTHTLSGPVTVDTSDARISVNTNTLLIPGGTFTFTPAAQAANGVVSFTGDFAGFVKLQGSNPQFATNGIKLVNAVEVSFDSEDSLGGPTAPITFSGDATLDLTGHPTFTTFGAHPINTASFGGGLNIPTGQSFTLDRALTGGQGLGKRGMGSLTINAPITGTGTIFWDGGNIDVNQNVTVGSLNLRSPVVNVATGVAVTMNTGNASFGASATGTNGGPDIAVINLNGTASLTQNQGNDFFLSDGANTKATLNINDNASFTTNGLLHVARNAGGEGIINQAGGTFTLKRTGDFTLVLGSRNGVGRYNLSAGTMTSAGQFYVGQGGAGVGFFTMTGGVVNQNNTFAIGREGGQGTVDISAGTINKGTTGNSYIDHNAGVGPSTMTLRGTAKFLSTAGEFWIGRGNGSDGTLTMMDNAELTTNNWTVVARNASEGVGTGKLIMSGNSKITKTGGGGNHFIVGDGANGTVTMSDSASIAINFGQIWVGQAGTGNGSVTIQNNASVTASDWLAIGREGGTGVVNLSGGSITKIAGTTNHFIVSAGTNSKGTLNQTGGAITNTVSETWISEGATTTAVWNMSGGTATLGILDVGHNNNSGNGTLNVSGTASLSATNLRVGAFDAASGTVNLDGGTVAVNQVSGGGGAGTKTFNFNGGTLRARTNNATFMQGLTAANVKDGGARIDTNGFNVTVNQSLAASGTGGLTKSGAGVLRLGGTNTYTGGTNVLAGGLHANKPASLPDYATPGKVTLAAGTTLFGVNAGGAGEWTAPEITTARSVIGLPTGSTLAIDTSNAAAPFAYDQAITESVGFTKLGGGTLVLSGANTYTGATTADAGTLTLTSAAWGPVLTGPGGAVVNAGRLAFDYTGTGSPVATVAGLLKASHDSLNFRDPAQRIRTTNPAEANHSLGYVDDGAAVSVAYAWNGDANLDGDVDLDDYALIDRGRAMGLTHWFNGDFNYDLVVDAADYLAIDTSFGTLHPGGLSPALLSAREAEFGSQYVSQLIAAVPEPTGLGLVCLGVIGVVGRRVRR